MVGRSTHFSELRDLGDGTIGYLKLYVSGVRQPDNTISTTKEIDEAIKLLESQRLYRIHVFVASHNGNLLELFAGRKRFRGLGQIKAFVKATEEEIDRQMNHIRLRNYGHCPQSLCRHEYDVPDSAKIGFG